MLDWYLAFKLPLQLLLLKVYAKKLENLKYRQKIRVYTPRERFKEMSSAKLRASRNPVIMPWLAGELENEIPDLDIHGSEKRLLEFAYQDLETCLTEKFRDTTSDDIEEILNDETRQDEVKSFLKVWTNAPSTSIKSLVLNYHNLGRHNIRSTFPQQSIPI